VSWKYLFLAVHQEDADVTILRRKFFLQESVLCKQRDIFANNPKISIFVWTRSPRKCRSYTREA